VTAVVSGLLRQKVLVAICDINVCVRQ